MKINLQINIPVDKKKLLENAGKDFESLFKELGAAEELVQRDQADYYVHLSKDARTPKKLLASHIRAANEERARGRSQPSPEQLPPAMTAALEKPREDFDSFINKIASSGKQLLDAHNPIDPKVVMNVLS